jgi:hypothetical protein
LLPPFALKDEFKCPHCGIDISFYNFQGCELGHAIYDPEDEHRVSWEIKGECFICGKPIFAYLWIYELSGESKFEKLRKGL